MTGKPVRRYAVFLRPRVDLYGFEFVSGGSVVAAQPIRLVAVDLDGTLLNDSKKVSGAPWPP
jgi:hypothetical protein